MSEITPNTNDIYMFMPWVLPEASSFAAVRRQLSNGQGWKPFYDTCRYLYRFVGQRFAQTDENGAPLPDDEILYYHYFRDQFRGLPLLPDDGLLQIRDHIGKTYYSLNLKLLQAHIYVYQTGIGIIALRLFVESEDFYDIGDVEFILKKAGKASLCRRDDPSGRFCPLDMARELLRAPLGSILDRIEFLSLSNMEKWADIAAYVRIPQRNETGDIRDYDKELFYLRNCFGRQYSYSPLISRNEEECYCNNPSSFWGLSTNGIVLLHALPEDLLKADLKGFNKVFYKNFHTEYLFLIVYMLHEKYVLHRFMSDLDVRSGRDLDKLKKYKEDLAFFNVNYVFTSVSNVPQYRIFHEKFREALQLRRLYADVNEPLTTLRDLMADEEEQRRQAAAEEEKKQDAHMEKLLRNLALLGIFSALTDAVSFAIQLRDIHAYPLWSIVLQAVFILLVLGVAVPILVEMWRDRKK